MDKLNIYEKILKVEELLTDGGEIIKFLNNKIDILENKIQKSSNFFNFDIINLFEKYNKIIIKFYNKKKLDFEKIDKEKVKKIKNHIKMKSILSKFQNIENENDFIFIYYFLANETDNTMNILFLNSIETIEDYSYIKKIMKNNDYKFFFKKLNKFFDNLNLDVFLKNKLGIIKNEIVEKNILNYFDNIKKILNLDNHNIYDEKLIEKNFDLLKIKKLGNNSNYLDFWDYYHKKTNNLNYFKKVYPINYPINNRINNQRKLKKSCKKNFENNLSFIEKHLKIINCRKIIKKINTETNEQNCSLDLYKNEYLSLNNKLIQMEKNINLKKNLKILKNLQIQRDADKNNHKLTDRIKTQEKKLENLTFNHKLDLILLREKINKIKDKILDLEINISRNYTENNDNKYIFDISKDFINNRKNKILNDFKYYENQKIFHNRKKKNLHLEKLIFFKNNEEITETFNNLSILNDKKNLLLDEIKIKKIYIDFIKKNLNNFLEKDIDNEINNLIKNIEYPDIINKKLKIKIKLLIKKKIEFLIYIFILKYELINTNDYNTNDCNTNDYITYFLIKNIKNVKINIQEKFKKYNSNLLKNLNNDITELNYNRTIKQKIIDFKKNIHFLKKEYNILSKFI